MMTLTEDMKTGVAKIDEQHQELINRINAVVSMGTQSVTKEEPRKTLDFLGAYVIKHFGDEQSLQRQCTSPKYEKYEWHKNQHDTFISSFKQLEEEFSATGPSAKFTVKLNSSVIDWIINHIKTVDVEFGKFYLAQQK
jgi:hemerythrin